MNDREPLTLFDVARAYSRRVPMAKSLLTEPDVRSYLSCVLVDAMWRTKEVLTVPTGLQLKKLSEEEWTKHKLAAASQQYEALGVMGQHMRPRDDEAAAKDMSARIGELEMNLKVVREILQRDMATPEEMEVEEDEVSSSPTPQSTYKHPRVNYVEYELEDSTKVFALGVEKAVWSKRVGNLDCKVVGVAQPSHKLAALPVRIALTPGA